MALSHGRPPRKKYSTRSAPSPPVWALLTFPWVDSMIMISFALGASTCGYGRYVIICRGQLGSAAVPRVVEGRPLPSTTLPGGAVEARRSRVARAPSRSDAKGALDLGGTAPQAARRRRRHPQKRHKSPRMADLEAPPARHRDRRCSPPSSVNMNKSFYSRVHYSS